VREFSEARLPAAICSDEVKTYGGARGLIASDFVLKVREVRVIVGALSLE
jgi:hypothetical protein